MEIIGLSGYARSGKDEVAKIFVKNGYTRVAFADKLREVLYTLNPIVLARVETPMGTLGYGQGVWHVQEVIERYGWDGYKESPFGPEIRRLLQRLGTEAGRETLWDSIWIDAAFAGYGDDAKIVVTDVRFENEADAIKQRGGSVLRVSRPGVDAFNDHPSETSLDTYDFDGFIQNDGTLEKLEQTVRRRFL